MQRLSLAFHGRQNSADALHRLQVDATSIRSVSVYGVIPFATSLVKVIALVYVTARIDLTLALVAISAGPIVFGLTELYRGRLRRRWSEARESESSALSVVQESLGAMRVVKAFGQEQRESARFRRPRARQPAGDAGRRARSRHVRPLGGPRHGPGRRVDPLPRRAPRAGRTRSPSASCCS